MVLKLSNMILVPLSKRIARPGLDFGQSGADLKIPVPWSLKGAKGPRKHRKMIVCIAEQTLKPLPFTVSFRVGKTETTYEI